MPLIKDDAATEHEEIRQAQNAEEQAEQARTTHSDETTYNFSSFMMSADMNELHTRGRLTPVLPR